MCEENKTKVTEFHLLGFRSLYKFRTLFFYVLLVIYMMIVVGNLLIILFVSFIDYLKIPMFFFLKHLALADVLLATSVIPVMLDSILKQQRVISVVGCIVQMYVFGVFGFVQCYLMAIMSYDRYLAICDPLHYLFIMNSTRCCQLIASSWALVVTLVSSEIGLVSKFEFCGLNTIDHFFCDFSSVVELSSSDITAYVIEDFVLSFLTLLFPFAFVIITYICIFITILKITSTTGRKKAFSTCSSHLTAVCIYYVTLLTVYMGPSDKSNVNMYRSLLYIVVTPLMNPIIYSLRNQNIKRAVKNKLKRINVDVRGVLAIHLGSRHTK